MKRILAADDGAQSHASGGRIHVCPKAYMLSVFLVVMAALFHVCLQGRRILSILLILSEKQILHQFHALAFPPSFPRSFLSLQLRNLMGCDLLPRQADR